MKLKYAGKTDEKTAQASGYALSISKKHAIEIGNTVRGLPVKRAKAILERVLKKQQAIAFTRFHGDVGHKPGKMAAGRYPLKASEKILGLIKSAESNAKQKGLEESALTIEHFSAQKGPSQWRYGRKRRRQAKRTHIMVILREQEKKKTVVKKKAPAKTAAAPTKKEEKKETPKQPAPKKTEQSKDQPKPTPKKEEKAASFKEPEAKKKQ